MKKLYTFLLIGIFVISSAGCQKDNLALSGTKWAASVGDIWATLYFQTSSSVIFTMGYVNDLGHSETLPYKVSGNTITLDAKPLGTNSVFVLEKGEKYIYWDWKSLSGQDMVLKFIQQ